MSRNLYIRDSKLGVLLLGDKKILEQYHEKKSLEEQISVLEKEINTVKAELQAIKSMISEITASK